MNKTYEQIEDLISFIVENKLEEKPLEEIAARMNLSPAHVQKLFTNWVGISPKQFGRFLSLGYAKELLRDGETTEQTSLLTGLSSTGRLHDLFVDIEAMTPGEYKNQGKNLKIDYSIFDGPFGRCLVATTDRGVCNVLFASSDSKLVADLSSRWPEAEFAQSLNTMQQTIADYIAGVDQSKKIKLHLHGSNFQLKVWEALLLIPEGAITSYGAIAKSIQQPTLSRAVGSAVGGNPIGYIIPCHRVLKSTGEISGYRWGVERKRAMLGYEALKNQ